jgi:branched-chain amino acid aminotransferase
VSALPEAAEGTSPVPGAVVLLDGHELAPHAQVISVFDRGFLFGDAVFEVLRTYDGVPFAQAEHLARLARSCALLGLDAPLEHVPSELATAVRRCRAAGAADCYVRLVVTRGEGPLHLDPAPCRRPRRLVIAAPLLPLSASLASGVSMATVRAHRAADGTEASAAKVTAYVGNLLAYVEARRRGAYEALLTTETGEVLEGHSSSFFVVRGGRVETPPASMGILPGITRAMIARAAAGLGIPFVERVLVPSEIHRADEAFLTSSLREVVPVIGIDGVAVGAGTPGPVTQALAAGYRALVRAAASAAEQSG